MPLTSITGDGLTARKGPDDGALEGHIGTAEGGQIGASEQAVDRRDGSPVIQVLLRHSPRIFIHDRAEFEKATAVIVADLGDAAIGLRHIDRKFRHSFQPFKIPGWEWRDSIAAWDGVYRDRRWRQRRMVLPRAVVIVFKCGALVFGQAQNQGRPVNDHFR